MHRLLLLTLALAVIVPAAAARPRVFVFTDINIDAGDPDDRQSLVHVLWYADELEIVGLVPDRWDARGFEACQQALAAYAEDYAKHPWAQRGYPSPARLRERIATDRASALQLFAAAAAVEDSPLWVLVWGNLQLAGEALRANVDHAHRFRLITIGTGLMLEADLPHLPPDWTRDRPCVQLNWNGAGRNEIYQDPRFQSLWWLEINWTYNGMFTGEEPKQMFDQLANFGALGRHLTDVTLNQPWARYFRVGDTPSALYLIDPRHVREDPTQSSWAGRFARPFPSQRPHYTTDHAGAIDWDYADPCRTWSNHPHVLAHSRGTLEAERPHMYASLLEKLHRLYATDAPAAGPTP